MPDYQRQKPATIKKQQYFYDRLVENLLGYLNDYVEGTMDNDTIDHFKINLMDWTIGEYERNYLNDKFFGMCIGAFEAFEEDYEKLKKG